jgi:hypothetical protein
MKFIMFVMMFFVLSALLIISNNNFGLSDKENIVKFGNIYVKWMDKFFDNIWVTTGNAVKLDWFPRE